MPDRREIAAVFVGGGIGSLARAALSEAYPWVPPHWPWPTFIANVTGALLLGCFVTLLQERLRPTRYLRPLLGTGLCGGLTTFSTMQVEIVRMLDGNAYGLAAGYTAASVAAGVAAVQVATWLTRRVRA